MDHVTDSFARAVRIIVSDKGAMADRVIAALREVQHCGAADFPTPQIFEAFRRLRDDVTGNRPTAADALVRTVKAMGPYQLDAIENRLMDVAEMLAPPAPRRTGRFEWRPVGV
jgi:hypothetical protein